MPLTRTGRAWVLWVWLSLLSYSLPAAAQSLSLHEGLLHYDYASLAWAIVVAVVGGIGRTVLTLLSTNTVVLSVLREAWKDVLIAGLAGLAMWLLIAAYNSVTGWPALPIPVTVLLIAASGWARMGFFRWAEKSGEKLADDSLTRARQILGLRDTPDNEEPPTP